MDSVENIQTQLQSEITSKLNHWYTHYWQPFISGSIVNFQCNSLYDTKVAIKHGHAFISKVLFLELQNPRDTAVNQQINIIAKDLYSTAIPLALADLHEEVYVSFREVCNRIIVKLHDNDKINIDLVAFDKTDRFRMSNQTEPNSVFLVHGRDFVVRNQIAALLRDWDIRVFEWEDLIIDMGIAMPYIFDVVDYGLMRAHAMIILFTPDEEVRLKEGLGTKTECEMGFQPRPNVILEAGMALGKGRNHTIIIQSAPLREITDLAGMNNVRMTNPNWKYQLAKRLIAVKCKLEIGIESLRDTDSQGEAESELLHQIHFAPDPIDRRRRLIRILNEYGGPTGSGWINDITAEDYNIKKEAEEYDEIYPLVIDDLVYVQMHSRSEYNGNIGSVIHNWRSPHHYVVHFEGPGLNDKAFNVMYLSKIST